jgi:hypothetical protein
MPGGKGNIKPEDGKQFSSSYQPREKWTEKKALELGLEMIEWLNEVDNEEKDVGNILFEEFLVIKKGLYIDVISYLKGKFSSFLEIYEKAKKIQEIKITKYGLADRLNASMAKFILSATHKLSDKVVDEKDDKDTTITLNFGGAIDLDEYRDDSKE